MRSTLDTVDFFNKRNVKVRSNKIALVEIFASFFVYGTPTSNEILRHANCYINQFYKTCSVEDLAAFRPASLYIRTAITNIKILIINTRLTIKTTNFLHHHLKMEFKIL